MDILNIKDEVNVLAKKEGFLDWEIYYKISKNTSISVFKSELDKFQSNSSNGLSFRGIIDGVMGYSYTEKIDKNSLENMVKKAKQNAIILDKSESEEIFSGSDSYHNVETFSPSVENIEVDEMLDTALSLEKKILDFSELIKACNTCSISKSSSEIFLINSKGLNLYNKSNLLFVYASCLAKKEEDAKTFGDFFVGESIKEFDEEHFAKKIASKAISYLGASSVKSGEYKLIIENECFADLLSQFVSNFYGENVQKGFSLLKGKLNEKIANEKITILDNPLLKNGFGSSSFDSEGVACYNKTVVENGVLKTFLYNLKSAKKDGVKSTGNGFKSSYKDTVSTSSTNFYISPSEKPLEEIFKNVKDGIFITSLSGLHSGANSISGDFSLLAEGFLIKNSKINAPVEQITIAGNFYEILKNISEIGSDLKFNLSGFGSPSVYIGKLSVSGN